MKAKHSYPAGQTPASRLKALLACLEANTDKAVAEAWLTKSRLARSDLEDETRLLPLVALHSALKAFVEVLRDPHALDLAAPYLVARDNLGVWARVLRGTRAPEEAFARFEAAESEHGRTTRWETLESGAGHWRGRVKVVHDPLLEKDGLLAKARALELGVVPMLFGYPPAHVVIVESGDDTQVFEARWTLPSARRGLIAGIGLGAVAGVGIAALMPSALGYVAAGILPLGAAVVGTFGMRERTRRIDTAAQAMRVSALERSLVLRDTESRAAAGDLEGVVVAGQYRIRERMGSGASGVIYEATRITDGVPVAIKLLRAATAHDATASDRLRRESEALGLSWHPNVVEVIDHGHLPDGTSYLVMELLQGETLATRLKVRVRLRTAEVFPIAKQVTEALVAIHAAGVVHRDLKPSNVYLVPHEGSELVKVFDFGIARVEWEEMRITNMGAPLGTPGYMPPEQEMGAEVDARSDVFSVGAMLYECLVGEPPPLSPGDMWTPGTRLPSSIGIRVPAGADSGVQPASRRLPSAAPVAVSADPSAVDAPPAWRALIERALARKPDDRFQDARALLNALKALEDKSASPADAAGER